VSMIQSQELTSHVEISSFDHAKLARVHSLDPSISTGALFSSPCPPDFVERSKNVHASEVHLRYDTCSAARVREAKEADLKVMAWFRGPLSMKQGKRKMASSRTASSRTAAAGRRIIFFIAILLTVCHAPSPSS